jgi:hypothetical protein
MDDGTAQVNGSARPESLNAELLAVPEILVGGVSSIEQSPPADSVGDRPCGHHRDAARWPS